jgi:hypothetical protein
MSWCATQPKKPIPHPTLIAAAQLAAYFSQAKKDPKVDVHYTERKIRFEDKRRKPGLVRMQRFKNITVEPKEAERGLNRARPTLPALNVRTFDYIAGRLCAKSSFSFTPGFIPVGSAPRNHEEPF